jgi:prepilin-type N-terminal cleavage/methylation domain-containing protein
VKVKNQNGITLVELLVTIAIMGVILIPTITIVTMFMGTHSEVMESNELQHEARFLIEYMEKKIKNGATWDEVENSLMSEGQAILSYEPSDNKVEMVPPEGSYVFTEHVTSFTVTEDTPGEITIELHLSNDSGEEYKIRTTVLRRNKQING